MKIVKISFEKKGLGLLSPLEADVLNVIWKKEIDGMAGMRVRDVHKQLKDSTALTSVAVILDRLHNKKIVRREIETGRGGTHYIYYSKVSKHQFEKTVVEGTVEKLIDNFGHVAVNYFNERFSKKK